METVIKQLPIFYDPITFTPKFVLRIDTLLEYSDIHIEEIEQYLNHLGDDTVLSDKQQLALVTKNINDGNYKVYPYDVKVDGLDIKEGENPKEIQERFTSKFRTWCLDPSHPVKSNLILVTPERWTEMLNKEGTSKAFTTKKITVLPITMSLNSIFTEIDKELYYRHDNNKIYLVSLMLTPNIFALQPNTKFEYIPSIGILARYAVFNNEQ
jgi:hypothetical protein